MKKNAFLTFIFACIPGAGAMYYGYMQRGLSLITLFCLCLLLGDVLNPLVLFAIVVWMYSFFDTYDLIRHLAAGDPKPDGLLLLGDFGDVKELVPKHHKLLGWGLILVGIWALWDRVLREALLSLLGSLLGDWGYNLVDAIPTVLVAVVLILAGFWLLGLHPAKTPQAEDLPPYPEDATAPQPPTEDEP